MSVEIVSIRNIELGSLAKAIDENLGIVAKDIIERPHTDGPRKVCVEITLKPEITTVEGQAINQPAIDWKVEHRMPGCKGITTRAFVDSDKLVINTGQPLGGNAGQTTIFDTGGEES